MSRQRIKTVMLETLVAFARDRLDISSIRLRTRTYLMMADAFEVSDPSQSLRVVPTDAIGVTWAITSTFDLEARRILGTRMIRVGPAFFILGPVGDVRIEEDNSP